jgi:hypothetical protein
VSFDAVDDPLVAGSLGVPSSGSGVLAEDGDIVVELSLEGGTSKWTAK